MYEEKVKKITKKDWSGGWLFLWGIATYMYIFLEYEQKF